MYVSSLPAKPFRMYSEYSAAVPTCKLQRRLCCQRACCHIIPRSDLAGDDDGMRQVWALGCVLYSLLVGKLPFDGEDKVEQVYNILNKELKFPSRIKRDPDLLDLLTRMLDRNPRHRITVEEALRHPWVRCMSLSVLPDRVPVILCPRVCVRVDARGCVCLRR